MKLMKNNYSQNLAVTISLILMALFLPNLVKAGVVSISGPIDKAGVGDIASFSVTMDTENKNINVIEGEITVVEGKNNFLIKELSVAGSDFRLWPIKPSFSESMGKISFTAGTPGGINKKNALLFKVIFQAEGEGQVVLAPSNIRAYANDGRATPVEIKVNPINFAIGPIRQDGGKNELGKIIIGDNKKPWGLIAEIGRDDSVFDGKSFVFFSAFDNESGIGHFEVKEGARDFVRSGSIYVFQNQQKLEPTMIVAYDKAGNSRKLWLREKTYWEKNNLIKASFYGLSGLLLIMAIIRIILAFKSSNKK